MSIAVCDPDAFYPLRALVQGPFESLEDLPAIERFARTVVLHDEVLMEGGLIAFNSEEDDEFTEEEKEAGGRSIIVGIRPTLEGYDFFTDNTGPAPPVPNVELSPALIESAAQFANAGPGNVYYEAHINYLKRLLGTVEQGGSLLLCDDFGQLVTQTAQKYPDELFRQLDQDWQKYAKHVQEDGSGFLVPPVLGIILTRCARREAIPAIILDLRNEWADARRKVWELIDAMRKCQTLEEGVKIGQALSEASRLFSPTGTETDTQPLRVLWELVASATAGGTVATLSGGSPVVGAAGGLLVQAARSLPPLAREFGPSLFGRGALDLARRVRKGVAKIEIDALPNLLSDAEKGKLGFY